MPLTTGVFCLEGDWDDNLRSRQSVEPMLQLLADCGELSYIHRDVATREDVLRAEEEVLALGARFLHDSGGETRGFRVYEDLAGHPFCLCYGQFP